MGNDITSTFRGEGDIPLQNVISTLSEEEVKKYLQDADAAGVCDASDYANKQDVMDRLKTFDPEQKV